MTTTVVRRADPAAVCEILALLAAMEADIGEAGVKLLGVHTVGPSSESGGYARAGESYLAHGVIATNELPKIDCDGPAPILVKPL